MLPSVYLVAPLYGKTVENNYLWHPDISIIWPKLRLEWRGKKNKT